MIASLVLGLTGCGGQNEASQTPKVSYASVVSFGDSLSDPGAYRVGQVAQLGGGLFTVNGITGAAGSEPVPSYTWAQLVSAAATGQVSCAARTGGFGVSVTNVTNCTNYAQGGSRVTDPNGTGRANGALTEPIVTQVANYLSRNNGVFTGQELVTVQGGANELFAQAGILTDAATSAGNTAGSTTFTNTLITLLAQNATNPSAAAQAIGLAMQQAALQNGSTQTTIVSAAVLAAASQPGNSTDPNSYNAAIVSATNAATTAGNLAAAQYIANTGAPNAITAMVTAAAQLSASVNNMISLGAKRVVVTNLPDVSLTPYALSTINGADNSTQQLVLAMTMAFNERLRADLANLPKVLFIDVFTENRRQIADPTQFGLSNVTGMACNLDYPNNLFATQGVAGSGSSLVCNTNNLIAGNTSRYLFADSVHPTPYGHKLLAQLVTKELILAGWL
ncbi:SGNH/GDSL hydrolase family protein [Limnohabitans sp. DCL3]|uniref:SGNH/GDSL hydrolase family protein n=1 Tax=Limnohabitans sp. DCL3 TaxID=3374103 RepID=UPI003A877965